MGSVAQKLPAGKIVEDGETTGGVSEHLHENSDNTQKPQDKVGGENLDNPEVRSQNIQSFDVSKYLDKLNKKPKPKVEASPEKEVVIYMWDGKIKFKNLFTDGVKAAHLAKKIPVDKPKKNWVSVGHLSMEIPQYNIYISFWPSCGDADEQLYKGTPGYCPKTLKEDIKLMDEREPDKEIKVYTFDEIKILNEFIKFKNKVRKKEVLYCALRSKVEVKSTNEENKDGDKIKSTGDLENLSDDKNIASDSKGMNCASVVEMMVDIGGENPKFYEGDDNKRFQSGAVSYIIDWVRWIKGGPCSPHSIFKDVKNRLKNDLEKYDFVDERGNSLDDMNFRAI